MITCKGYDCDIKHSNVCCVVCSERDTCENKCTSSNLKGECNLQIIPKEENEI